jgi:TM2 domain-containing membrane protein YozV
MEDVRAMTNSPAPLNSTNEAIRKTMLNSKCLAALLSTVLGVVMPGPALAYIGPGAGLGVIAVTVTLILGVLLLVIGLVWYPLKRLLKGKTGATANRGRRDGSE